MMICVPALGVPNEELLQDSLKSMLVAFFSLGAAITFFWGTRKSSAPMVIHALLVLPILLCVYAVVSMTWSHAYLGGVEAVRWFLFSLLVFLGANTLTQARLTQLCWAIHLGAFSASLWTALQFWFEFSFFAQGPNPASTFVNRNFFGEFVVCTFPISVLLLTRIRDKVTVIALAFSLAFNVVALMQTGTRSALVGLLILVALVPFLIIRGRQQVVSSGWRLIHGTALLLIFIAAIFLLASIPTTNGSLLKESPQRTAFERASARAATIAQPSEYQTGSFSVRAVMWKATLGMIEGHPFAGVGAGAWEVNAPLYQEPDSMLETDYYAHNEFLQLIAEYGLIGWIFLLCLLLYLGWVMFSTWTNRSTQAQPEVLLRLLTVAGLLMLLLVSNAGFPWRMATTGALFALYLSILAASDTRIQGESIRLWYAVTWRSGRSYWLFAATSLCSLLAIFIAQQAVECESKIVRAVKISIMVSQSGHSNSTEWDSAKAEMLQLVRDGVAINPHYRKITPIVADALASWGDWKNAIWIWESVLQSRPYVTAILTNLTRAYIQAASLSQAEHYLQRAETLRPSMTNLHALRLDLLTRTARWEEAGLRAKEYILKHEIDPNVIKSSYYIGMHNRDPELAISALDLRIRTWPEQAVDGWLKLGAIYAAPEAKDEAKAVKSFQSALNAAALKDRDAILAMVPPKYRPLIH
jgi:O-antigen ligase